MDLEAARERKRVQQENKGDMFLAYLELAKRNEELKEEGKAYEYRYKFPDPVLEYCDWFVRMSGLEPDLGDWKGWLKDFNLWLDRGYTIEVLDKTWHKIENEGWIDRIIRPGGLTARAKATMPRKTFEGEQPNKYISGDYAEFLA